MYENVASEKKCHLFEYSFSMTSRSLFMGVKINIKGYRALIDLINLHVLYHEFYFNIYTISILSPILK